MNRRLSAVGVFLLICWSFALPLRTTAGELRGGAFAMDVTPLKFPISMNGNMQDAPAKKAADPLHARCLVLDDGQTRAWRLSSWTTA